MNNLFASKKTMALIIFLLFLAFLLLVYTLFFKPTSNSQAPLPSPTPRINVNTGYDIGRVNQDAIRISKHKPLSASDEKVREQILEKIGNKSGMILSTSTFQIDYVATIREYLVRIDSPDTDKAKKDSEQWFMQQGLSQQGICNLPVVYYLGAIAMQSNRQENKQFNPIPDGCE